MLDFEKSTLMPIIADLLMGAAYADAHFDGREGEAVRAKLRAFLELEELAAELYTMEHSGGLGSDLSELRDAQGRNFEGFSGEGTWLFSLRCETCANPAPLFLTVLLPWSE